MNTQLSRKEPATPVITLSAEGHPVTTSLVVAEHFGKRHRDVLRAIRQIEEDLAEDDADEFRVRNFAQTVIERENPSGGAPIASPAYLITRDGFTLLAMGFTGKEALRWKRAYITAFNAMEARLRGLHMLPEEEDRDMHRKVSPRLWPILHKQSHALLVQVKTATDPDVRRNAFWALYRVNTALGIPVPSMQVLGVQPLALPAANAPDVSR